MAAAVMAIRERYRRRRRQNESGGNAAEPTVEDVLAQLDQDGDGIITAEELAAAQAKGALKQAFAAPPSEQNGRNPPKYMNLWKQDEVRSFYNNEWTQRFVAAVIVINFLAIIIEKEIDPYPSTPVDLRAYRNTWRSIDYACNIIFIAELAINVYGNCIWPFLKDGWNYLDTVVVLVAIISLAPVSLGSFSQIKVLRAFRVLRLFKRIESLRKILTGLIKSIPGVINAFVVMLIFMCIYAILAVDLFRDFGDVGTYDTLQYYGPHDGQYGPGCGVNGMDCAAGATFSNQTAVRSITPRGFYYGQEYYGTFFRALYTLFQVLTGESWSEAVVRPILFGMGSVPSSVVAIFFTTYILLTQLVLQNVVVAVLLDKFVVDPDEKKPSTEEEDDADAAAPKDDQEPVAAVASVSSDSGSPKPTSSVSPGRPAYGEMSAALDTIMREQAEIRQQLQVLLDRIPSEAKFKPLEA